MTSFSSSFTHTWRVSRRVLCLLGLVGALHALAVQPVAAFEWCSKGCSTPRHGAMRSHMVGGLDHGSADAAVR